MNGKELFLGTTPNNIKELNKEDLFDYFIYTFAFSLNTKSFVDKNIIKNIKKEYIEIIDSYDLINSCNEKKWWLLNLIALKIISKKNQLYFAINVIEDMLVNIKISEIFELELCINKINLSLLSYVNEGLSVRPNQIFTFNATILENDIYLRDFLKNKEIVMNILKEHIRYNELDISKLNQTCRGTFNKYSKFSNVWIELFDLLAITTINTFYDIGEDKTLEYRLPKVIQIFLDSFLKIEIDIKKIDEKVEKINKKLYNILKE